MNIPTSVYIAKASLIHSCSAGVKIVLLIAYSAGLFFLESWWGMAIYAVLCLAVMFASRISIGLYAKVLVPAYVMAGFALLFSGWDPGLFFAIRIILLALASFIVCFTTTPTALTKAFTIALRPFRVIKLPVDDIATVLSLSLRFIPLMAVEVQQIHDAQVARGAQLDNGSPFERIKAWTAVFIPLFVGLFRKADRLAQAMDARCYGMPGVAKTSLDEGALQVNQVAAAVCGIALLGVTALFL